MPLSANATVSQWLRKLAETAVAGDLDAHMALISPSLQLFGVPGFETLGYDDWRQQCAHEFPQRLVTAIHYGEPRIRTATDSDILFSVLERIETRDSLRAGQPVEMLLRHEDGSWRLLQQRILDESEAAHLGLI